ncbi:MAG: DMT family transporter [Pseudomonadota bacterium]
MSAEPTPNRPGLDNWIAISVLGVVWGSAFMSMSVALRGFEPLTLAAIRVVVGALVLTFAGALMGQSTSALVRSAAPRDWGFLCVIGVITVTVPFLLLVWGLQFVSSSFAGIAMGTVPLLILPLAYFFSPDEGIGPRRIVGVCLGFIGLLALVDGGDRGAEVSLLGQLACVAAACCYAVGSIVTRRAPRLPPVAFAAVTLWIGAAFLVPLALIVDGLPARAPAWLPLVAVLYLGAMPTGMAAVLRVKVIQSAGSVFMSQTSYQVPLWAAVFGVMLLGEEPGLRLFGGLALILGGIAVSQSRPRR